MKYCIISILTGNYDLIRDPENIDDNCDYFFITDNKNLKSNIWNIIYVDFNDDLTSIQRNYIIKYSLYKYIDFNKYDYIVRVDASLQLKQNLSNIIKFLYNNNFDISVSLHDIYKHQNTLEEEYDRFISIKSLDKKYKDIFIDFCNENNFNYKQYNGLIECSCIIFKNSKIIFNLIDEIYNVLKNTTNFSDANDQCYFTYVLSKYINQYNIKVNFFVNEFHRNSKYMIMKFHNSNDYCGWPGMKYCCNKDIFMNNIINITDYNNLDNTLLNYKIYTNNHKQENIENENFLNIYNNFNNHVLYNTYEHNDELNINYANKTLCEFCSMYYVYMNKKYSNFVGFDHYRRLIDESSIYSINDDEIFVYNSFNVTLIESWNKYHYDYVFELVYSILKESKYNYMIKYLDSNVWYTCNIFIMKYEIFEKLFEFLWYVITTLDNKYFNGQNFNYERYLELFKSEYQARQLAFLIERLVSLFIVSNYKPKNIHMIKSFNIDT